MFKINDENYNAIKIMVVKTLNFGKLATVIL